MSQPRPIRFERKPVRPPPTSMTGKVLETPGTPNASSLLACMIPAPPTKYGRRVYVVRRRGTAITTLPVSVLTLLRTTHSVVGV